jgi:hypothetical protein
VPAITAQKIESARSLLEKQREEQDRRRLEKRREEEREAEEKARKVKEKKAMLEEYMRKKRELSKFKDSAKVPMAESCPRPPDKLTLRHTERKMRNLSINSITSKNPVEQKKGGQMPKTEITSRGTEEDKFKL